MPLESDRHKEFDIMKFRLASCLLLSTAVVGCEPPAETKRDIQTPATKPGDAPKPAENPGPATVPTPAVPPPPTLEPPKESKPG